MTGTNTQAMFGLFTFVTITLTGCAPDYSPNTYNGSALQQANKVDTGIVIGYREVKISDDGTIGAVTGGAAGGILGAEVGAPAVPTALAVLGGTVVGGVVGSSIQHATGDTSGWEYIVREPKGDLVSVTQRQPSPIPIGQRVLVIEGKQARIVPDYATTYDAPPAPKAEEKRDQEKPVATNSAPTTMATSASPEAAPAASGSAPAPDNAANAGPIPLSADKAQTPSDQPASASPAPPASPAAAPVQAEPSAPASAGNSNSPPAPPS